MCLSSSCTPLHVRPVNQPASQPSPSPNPDSQSGIIQPVMKEVALAGIPVRALRVDPYTLIPKPCTRHTAGADAAERGGAADVLGAGESRGGGCHARRGLHFLPLPQGSLPERDFFIDNLLVRNHSIIEIMRWTGLAPWELKFRFPVALHLPSYRQQRRGVSHSLLPQSSPTSPRLPPTSLLLAHASTTGVPRA